MNDHLDRDALERLVHRRCHASRAYGWLLHLLACIECRERVVRTYPGRGERFLREIFRTQEPLKPPDLEDQDRLDRVLENLQTYGLAEYLQEGDIPPLLADLHRHPPERQRLILDNTERLWNLGTVEHLFERCESEFFRDPRYGQFLAEMALSVLDRLSPGHYHPRLLNDLRGRAFGLRGNFLRLQDRFGAARYELKRAETSLDAGTGDVDERIRFLSFCGTLASSQRRFQQSMALHKRTLKMSRASGNRKAELKEATKLLGDLLAVGCHREAIQLGEDYLQGISPEQDGDGAVRGLQVNLAAGLSEAGWGLPAYGLYQEVLRNVPKDQPRITTRISWLQLPILESLGDLEAADAVAQSVMNPIVEHLTQESYGSVLTDRARLALLRGDRIGARKHAVEACQVFERCGWPHMARGIADMIAGGPLVYF